MSIKKSKLSPPIVELSPAPSEPPIISKAPLWREMNLFAWILLALLAVVLIWIVTIAAQAHMSESPSGFSAVYLSSGDVLVGRLSFSPTPILTDAWIAIHNSSTDFSAQGPINLISFKTTSASPQGTVHLNSQNILYWANIDPMSQLAKELAAKTQ